MKLSESAIQAMTLRIRNRIALELDCSVPTVDRWLKENESNGSLTKSLALKIISEESGLDVAQILESDELVSTQR